MKVGIVGAGGAGLCAAWFLDEQHEVVVWERNPVPGGHARTTVVERPGGVAYASDGFNWFSDRIYPRFMRLLEIIDQEMERIPMSAAFTDKRTERTLVMPPVGLKRIGRTLARPGDLVTLIKMARALSKAKPIVDAHDGAVTARDFMAGLGLGEAFGRDFLEPIMSAAWGCPHDRALDCSIYPLMKYFVFHAPNGLGYYWWHVVRGGAAAYARNMAGRLERAELRLGSGVEAVRRVDGGYEVRAGGETTRVDKLVVA